MNISKVNSTSYWNIFVYKTMLHIVCKGVSFFKHLIYNYILQLNNIWHWKVNFKVLSQGFWTLVTKTLPIVTQSYYFNQENVYIITNKSNIIVRNITNSVTWTKLICNYNLQQLCMNFYVINLASIIPICNNTLKWKVSLMKKSLTQMCKLSFKCPC